MSSQRCLPKRRVVKGLEKGRKGRHKPSTNPGRNEPAVQQDEFTDLEDEDPLSSVLGPQGAITTCNYMTYLFNPSPV